MDMKVDIEDIDAVKKRLMIEVPAAEVDSAFKAAYDAVRGDVTIEGFRKGKAPDNVLKQRFGEAIEKQVSKELVDRTFAEAVKQKELKLVSRPDIDTHELKQGAPFVYSAVLDVRPELNLDKFMDIGIETRSIEVADKEIDESLDMLRERNCRYQDTDKGVEQGCMVTVDVQARVDGALFEEGCRRDYSYKVGEGANFPEFDEVIIGKGVGEVVEFTKPFPEQYHDKKVAGKGVVFTMRLKGVKGKALPPLNDDFAKLLQCGSLDELRQMIRHELERVKRQAERDRQRKEYMDRLVEQNPFEVPESVIQNYFTQIMGRMFDGVRMGKVNPSGWGLDTKEAKEKYRELARKQAKGDIILDAICEKVDVEVTREEVEGAIREIAASKNTTPEAIQKRLEEQGTIGMLYESIKREKVFDVILGGKSKAGEAAAPKEG